MHFDPESLARLKGLKLRGLQIAEGFAAGVHRCIRQGQALEFTEHRPYVPGDDPKRIDWKVVARKDDYFVKQFENETNLECCAVVDISRSMQFPEPKENQLSKFEYAQCLVLTLTHFLLETQESIGIAIYGETIEQFEPPSPHAHSWNVVHAALDRNCVQGQTNAMEIANRLCRLLHRRSLIIWVSDFMFPIDSIEHACRMLQFSGHQVVLMQILDQHEEVLPKGGWTELLDAETKQRVTVSLQSIQRDFAREFEMHQHELSEIAMKLRADLVTFRTSQTLADVLPNYIAARTRLKSGAVAINQRSYRSRQHRGS